MAQSIASSRSTRCHFVSVPTGAALLDSAGLLGAASGLLASDFASVFVAGLASGLPSDAVSAFVSVFVAGLLPFFKSVADQPHPFSWKPAAETSLLNAFAWRVGHS